MKGSDMTLMIHKLDTLNKHFENDKIRLEKDVAYWEKQIQEFGEDKTTLGHTYRELLEITSKQLEYKLKELNENYSLIVLLSDEIENIYKY